jgi:hypothetical protein
LIVVQLPPRLRDAALGPQTDDFACAAGKSDQDVERAAAPSLRLFR